MVFSYLFELTFENTPVFSGSIFFFEICTTITYAKKKLEERGEIGGERKERERRDMEKYGTSFTRYKASQQRDENSELLELARRLEC